MNLGDVSVHLMQAATGARGCEVYFMVGDADELHEFHRANGVEIVVSTRRQGVRAARLLGP
jgi:hypothetical protein